jgi:mannose-6-phosphate isomerase-like protein (cupin superfamily)
MEYEFTIGEPITEQEARDQVAAMGFHGLAFDDVHEVDETLHWHEFDSVAWVISGTGSFADEHGNVTEIRPGCRLTAPAGWLHRTLAGTSTRIVLGTNLPYGEWTMPIDKDPADRPEALSV